MLNPTCFISTIANCQSLCYRSQALHLSRNTIHPHHVGSGAQCVKYTLESLLMYVHGWDHCNSAMPQGVPCDHSLGRCSPCTVEHIPLLTALTIPKAPCVMCCEALNPESSSSYCHYYLVFADICIVMMSRWKRTTFSLPCIQPRSISCLIWCESVWNIWRKMLMAATHACCWTRAEYLRNQSWCSAAWMLLTLRLKRL